MKMTTTTTTTTNPAKLLTEQELINQYWDGEDHKKWIELARLSNSSQSPVGYWICKVNTSDDVVWKYIK